MMIKKTDGFSPKIFRIKSNNQGEEKYPLQKVVYKYVFSKEDEQKLKELKSKTDVIAYKQDLILKNRFKIKKETD